MATTNIVFVKLVPSGKLESRILEAAYTIYDAQTRERIAKSFLFYHAPEHEVYEDTFSDYHTSPTEGDGRSLVQLCQDKKAARHTIQEFCAAFSADLQKAFPTTTRSITFVGDHIWQTRALLFPFMFCQRPWIKLPKRGLLVHFVEFAVWMQPFAVMYAQTGKSFELPRWQFRAQLDVNSQTNFFDNLVQMHARPITILKRGDCPRCPDNRAGECQMVDGEVCGNAKCSDAACQTDDE